MSPYQYERLNQERQEIRIFRHTTDLPDGTMVMQMETVSLLEQSRQAFITASYVWENSLMNRSTVIDDQVLLVTQNVYDLLHVLLRTEEFVGPLTSSDLHGSWWWIDSICINQKDLSDRASQVRIMGEIYKSSRMTIAYTGPAHDDSDWAMKWIERTGTQKKASERLPIGSTEASRMMAAFHKFHARPWFSRAWILQEWILPTIVIVLTGSTCLDSEALETAILDSKLACSNQLSDREYR